MPAALRHRHDHDYDHAAASSSPSHPSSLYCYPVHYRLHFHRPTKTKNQSRPRKKTLLLGGLYDKCSTLCGVIQSQFILMRLNVTVGNSPFDFFLPKPSLSTTSSAHLIFRLCAEAPRNRSVPDGVSVRCWTGGGVDSVWVVVAVDAVANDRCVEEAVRGMVTEDG